MENTRATAKDFFLHLGAIAALYAVAIALVNLLFTVINESFPSINQYNYYYYNSSSISLPVAALIIVFPIFLLLSRLLYRTYTAEPDKKQLAVRRWLTYITLFVAGIILVGDLVTVLYRFLDGQDLTMAFILKALVVFIITGAVFKFYLDEIRDRVAPAGRKTWAIITSIAILVAIILGFSVIGSPMTQRLLRHDNQKINDLQNIQWQLLNHYQRTSSLPQSLAALADPISGYIIPTDPQTGEAYEYRRVDNDTFELCAVFNKDSTESARLQNGSVAMPMIREGVSENWMHNVGRTCFTRNIDPTLYPPLKTQSAVRI
jgi:hypothetical protein